MQNPSFEFYDSKQEPTKSCLFALREIILEYHPSISETVKYGMPCFVYGKKHFCYLWTNKKTDHPYILMVEGNRITHPSLESGKRNRMKILPIDPSKDIPLQTIHEVFELALELYS